MLILALKRKKNDDGLGDWGSKPRCERWSAMIHGSRETKRSRYRRIYDSKACAKVTKAA